MSYCPMDKGCLFPCGVYACLEDHPENYSEVPVGEEFLDQIIDGPSEESPDESGSYCRNCAGTGVRPSGGDCWSCIGTGKPMVSCPNCHGVGGVDIEVGTLNCGSCGGAGAVTIARAEEIEKEVYDENGARRY